MQLPFLEAKSFMLFKAIQKLLSKEMLSYILSHFHIFNKICYIT